MGKTPIIGIASDQTKPIYQRVYRDGTIRYTRHAEMHLLDLLENMDSHGVATQPKGIWVIRKQHNGVLTMARPCDFCQARLLQAGINLRRVRYTDWGGQWKKLID